MDREWVKSQWKRADLEGKQVEFSLLRDGVIHSGIGDFWVLENPEGLLAVDVHVDMPGSHSGNRQQVLHHLSQNGADRIRKHPDTSVADFLLK